MPDILDVPDSISVEVVFALPDKQRLVAIDMAPGSVVADAIAASNFAGIFGEIQFDTLDVGIWGRICVRETPLKSGDRVEIYRHLEIDPREMRRQLALAGKTMRSDAPKGVDQDL